MPRFDWQARLNELKALGKGWYEADTPSPDPTFIDACTPLIEALSQEFWFGIYPIPDGGLNLEHFKTEYVAPQDHKPRFWLGSIELTGNPIITSFHSCTGEPRDERTVTCDIPLNDPEAHTVIRALVANDVEKNRQLIAPE